MTQRAAERLSSSLRGAFDSASRGDHESLRKEAHSLKGAAASLGCAAIAEQAALLEKGAHQESDASIVGFLDTLEALKFTTQQALLDHGLIAI
ncbi:Hpt domain-containing protein [Vreelandella piezotolerans]|uniref:Hpt domain-containing protein n=1 Tax=Vreelandella piezotolerans TaxID=2609667 RepID=UPI001FD3118B|nr:Hpt domain-containing protein [Halomonas piezotolerans]